jgi:hypothetical protein
MPAEPGGGETAAVIPNIPLFLIPKVIQEQIKKERAGISQIRVVRSPFNSFTVTIVRTMGGSQEEVSAESTAAVEDQDV